MTAAPAPRCCVIVFEASEPDADLAPALVPHVIWINGDEGDARKAADAWCRANPGQPAHIMVIDDTLVAELVVKGVKS